MVTATSEFLNKGTLEQRALKNLILQDDHSCVYPQIEKMTLAEFEAKKRAHIRKQLAQKVQFVKRVDLRQGEPAFFKVVLRNDDPDQPRVYTLEQ